MSTQPILAPADTWFTQMGTSLKRSIITEIEIKDSYTPAGAVDTFWDASAAKDGSVMVYVKGTNLIIAGNGSGKVYANPNSSWVFSDSAKKDYYSKLTKITGGNLLDTSKATTMERMFQYASALTTCDVGHWDTSKVKSMKCMFQACHALIALDTDDWNTSAVTDMIGMFNQCSSLKELNIANWSVSNVTGMQSMFGACESLTALDASKWDVSKVTTFKGMFENCYAITTVGNIADWKTGSCTNMSDMFSKCFSIEELNVSNWDVSKVTTFKSMFSGSSYGERYLQVTTLDVSNWDVSSATDMGWMFYGNRLLTTLDVSNWNVSKVTNFHHMFAWCTNLVLNDKVSNWDVRSGIHFNAMFHSNRNTHLDLSSWNVSNCQNFGQMFERNWCLEKIDGLANWNTSNGQSFYSMFYGCNALKELDLSSFDTRKANPRWVDDQRDDTTEGMDSKFFGSWLYNEDGSIQTYGWNMSLEKVILGPNFSFNGDGTCTNTAVLTAPSTVHVRGCDGNWYSANGMVYAPADIPNLTAGTYYASYALLLEDMSTRQPHFLDKTGLKYLWYKITKALSNKVDKIDGKGLSTNDFTDEYRSKIGSALQSYTETDPTVPTWAKAATKPTYTAEEVGALPADTKILPAVTANDAGKFMRVSSAGKWIAEAVPRVEEVTF